MEFINALRNTRVAPELPAVGVDTARNNFNSQKSQSRTSHWELASEFDYMLSQLLAQESMAAIEFTHRFRSDPKAAGLPEETPLTRVERLWGSVFPGRELHWRDWKPLIKNRSTATEFEYSGNQMSDGEKAALYMAGRVFTSEAGILVVDEPETHFHSLLAVRLWNALEDARRDVRFVYVTHDLTFALSRNSPRFVLASPTAGLRTIDVQSTLPNDVAEALLGAASLSFYATRVVFCEGDSSSLDNHFYGAWFAGPDTVVRPVGDWNRVIRCADVVANSGIATALTAVGVIDGDYHPATFRSALPQGTTVLTVHEIESLFCVPDLVMAVCRYVSQPFEVTEYRTALAATVSDGQRHQIIIERWKRRMEPHLEGLVAGVDKRQTPVKDIIAHLPAIFDHKTWSFSPEVFLTEERDRVEAAVSGGPLTDFLSIVPGKQLLPVAARLAGMNVPAYTKMVIDALAAQSDGLRELGREVEAALSSYLPPRYAPIKPVPAAP